MAYIHVFQVLFKHLQEQLYITEVHDPFYMAMDVAAHCLSFKFRDISMELEHTLYGI